MCDIQEDIQYSTVDMIKYRGASPRAETGPDTVMDGEYFALINTVNARYGELSVYVYNVIYHCAFTLM